jgi:putative phosphoribosyl transferase
MTQPPPQDSTTTQQLTLPAGAVMLNGTLRLPTQAHGIVLLAQGSKNIEGNIPFADIAQAQIKVGLATLIVPLLLEEEEVVDRETRFFRDNASIFSQRIIGIANWLAENADTQHLSIGYLGFGAAGAAALIAAAERPDLVHAVAAVDARTDLATSYLPRVYTPTLLIAAETNTGMTHMYRDALLLIASDRALAPEPQQETPKQIETIAGTDSLFATAESTSKVTGMLSYWFKQHLM